MADAIDSDSLMVEICDSWISGFGNNKNIRHRPGYTLPNKKSLDLESAQPK